MAAHKFLSATPQMHGSAPSVCPYACTGARGLIGSEEATRRVVGPHLAAQHRSMHPGPPLYQLAKEDGC